MKKKVQKEWTAALRSGELQQGASRLHWAGWYGKPDQFCCLGVLCEIAVKHDVIPPGRLIGGTYIYGGEGTETYLPAEVQKWAGLERDGGMVNINNEHMSFMSLAQANDSGVSFAIIADAIDAMPTED